MHIFENTLCPLLNTQISDSGPSVNIVFQVQNINKPCAILCAFIYPGILDSMTTVCDDLINHLLDIDVRSNLAADLSLNTDACAISPDSFQIKMSR